MDSGGRSAGRARVLVTGAAGFVGRHLVERCAARGAEVVGLGRRAADDAHAPAIAAQAPSMNGGYTRPPASANAGALDIPF